MAEVKLTGEPKAVDASTAEQVHAALLRRVQNLEQRLDAIDARIANFNTRSGHRI